ncbi:hypothetical protein TraAM80_06131 [Trypanosoma rangeli]|uniref:Ubiquitin-like domain-containing protein n=1 Tax=Trypanosoma rangeli TaxID=5698 RepID=A0A422NBI1_TRYRA|nr:uncharacterized protein TraAM80_06131 [Trypanosoma rangeli]RNF02847.1 hypothetical protein TraAM80_06131 [Trypanosoma rangeli]|eukprot:RNF02847.1 hypothetical protein TraAM80_06131 [Trypanosoma rangeli]
MLTHHNKDAGAAAGIRVAVTHAGQKMLLVFPTTTATVGDLKDELARRSGVPAEKQRLMFGGPVLKRHRREGRNEVRLMDLIAAEPQGVDGVGASAAAAAVTIPVMLVGSATAVPHINEEAMAQLHRLVSTTVELDSRWYRCSYSRGYARQIAFVCRTCVRNGRANPAHALCYACADVCHASHDVEEWGVRYYMRCDCCTAACWHQVVEKEPEVKGNQGSEEAPRLHEGRGAEDEPQHCCFLIDSATGLPPATSVVPLNSKNRYPRTLNSWCYCNCEDNFPADDTDGGGVVCMLCTTCYWSSHMTCLYSGAFRRIPCYGDVLEGAVVAFRCRTCDTLVCTPCRLRCHKDHDVDSEYIIPSRKDGTGNGAPEGVEFSCGCRGCCSIAEAVPEAEVEDPALYMSMPPEAAVEIMNNDPFMGFVCAHCMQEYPWLVENDPLHCYEGVLPERVPTEQHKRVVACGVGADAKCPSDVYPFHGMLLSVDAFTADMTCKCTPCREAYERFAPRATTASVNEMMLPLHDACDHCGHPIRDEQAFMCQTCELQHDRTFFVCQRCNALRIAEGMPPLGEAGGGGGRSSGRGEDHNGSTCPNEAAGVDPSIVHAVGVGNDNSNKNNEGEEAVAPWDHPLSHVFMEDTYENLFSLCGMQLMHNLDAASQTYVLENMDATSATFEGAVQRTFGQTPVVFDPDEVARHHQQLLRQREAAKEQNGGANPSAVPGQKRIRGGENGGGDKNRDVDSEKRGDGGSGKDKEE